jgi:hypothetical protein
MSANQRSGPALRPGLFLLGPDAVLVAGSGLIIRLRKDTVGSNPTRPTKHRKHFKKSPLKFGALAQILLRFLSLFSVSTPHA